jgi:hypothetical protein
VSRSVPLLQAKAHLQLIWGQICCLCGEHADRTPFEAALSQITTLSLPAALCRS